MEELTQTNWMNQGQPELFHLVDWGISFDSLPEKDLVDVVVRLGLAADHLYYFSKL